MMGPDGVQHPAGGRGAVGGARGLGQGSATARVARRPQPLPLGGALRPATHLPGGEPARRRPAATAASGPTSPHQSHPLLPWQPRALPHAPAGVTGESCEGTEETRTAQTRPHLLIKWVIECPGLGSQAQPGVSAPRLFPSDTCLWTHASPHCALGSREVSRPGAAGHDWWHLRAPPGGWGCQEMTNASP